MSERKISKNFSLTHYERSSTQHKREYATRAYPIEPFTRKSYAMLFTVTKEHSGRTLVTGAKFSLVSRDADTRRDPSALPTHLQLMGLWKQNDNFLMLQLLVFLSTGETAGPFLINVNLTEPNVLLNTARFSHGPLDSTIRFKVDMFNLEGNLVRLEPLE